MSNFRGGRSCRNERGRWQVGVNETARLPRRMDSVQRGRARVVGLEGAWGER